MTALRLTALKLIPPIWLIFVAVFAVVIWRDASFAEPASLMAFLKRSAPLVILAVGQLFVIVSGEFDLSVGALITACVVIAARLGEGEPGRTWWVILLLLGLGLLVGVVNGVVTTLLKVPSFITTLGMMLVLGGAVFLWTGGSPTGALAANFRRFGREGINDVPGVGQIPYSVIILLVVLVLASILLHHNRFGHQVFATGGGPRAAFMSGVDVRMTKIGAFVISAESAVIAGILLGGFAGLSAEAGSGYEFQAISAVVLGGAVLGGGRGAVGATVGGALTLEAMFTLLNLFGMAKPLRDTVQGVLIIAAVAFAAYRLRSSR